MRVAISTDDDGRPTTILFAYHGEDVRLGLDLDEADAEAVVEAIARRRAVAAC